MDGQKRHLLEGGALAARPVERGQRGSRRRNRLHGPDQKLPRLMV